MKKIIFVNGTMGIGKTATCLELQKLLPKNVFLDGDWCWNMEPFVVNDETKTMVMNNIIYLLNNFIKCSEYENIIFCWVMHEQSIIEDIISNLDMSSCQLYLFSLICSEKALIDRIRKDIDNDLRKEDVIDRSIPRLENYSTMSTVKIDVTNINAFQAANEIREKAREKTHGL